MRKRVIASLLLFGTVISFFIAAPSAFAETESLRDDYTKYYLMPYKIQSGDTLLNIYYCWGLNFYNYCDDIQSVNQLNSLDIIPLDVVLWLPTTQSNLQNDTYIQVISHTIAYGETASSICSAYGKTLEDCEKWMAVLNRDLDLTSLIAGTQILIPIR